MHSIHARSSASQSYFGFPPPCDGWTGIGSVAGRGKGVSLGVGEDLLALRSAPSGHGASPSRNGSELIGRGGVCVGFGRASASARDRFDGTGVGGMASWDSRSTCSRSR